jgi:predicted nucleic acid-binding protein
MTSKEKLTVKHFIEEAIIVDIIKHYAIEIREQYNTKLGDSIIAATALHTSLPFVTSDKGFK